MKIYAAVSTTLGLFMQTHAKVCNVSAWTPWTCNPLTGVQTRTRSIINSGSGCPSLKEEKSCDPVNCILGDWMDWTCDQSFKTRTRMVLRPAAYGGTPCENIPEVGSACDAVDCKMTPWSPWLCDPSTGKKERKRAVASDAGPGGLPCEATVEVADCDATDCLAQQWTTWQCPPALPTTGVCSCNQALSLPSINSAADMIRQKEIQTIAGALRNEQIYHQPVPGGNRIAMNYGIVPYPNTVAEKLIGFEHARFYTFLSQDIPQVLDVAATGDYSTIEGYKSIYDRISTFAPKSAAADFSDENFGYQRLTYKSFVIKKVKMLNYPDLASFVKTQVASICGARLSLKSSVFVEDYVNFVTMYADRNTSNQRNMPKVRGFFCVHTRSKKLLPFAIQSFESSTPVVFTPLDSEAEWTVAKMGLDACSISYQQMYHAITHFPYIPMRAEALRSMSFRHPINALITHHTYMDTGLFYLALGGVTSQGTGWDVVSGLGATGSTVFASDYLKNFTFGLDFEDDVRKRGLDELPNQKYVKYGRLLNKAIGSFTTGYVNAWYASDDDVLADGELQQWAAACAVLLKTNGFPAAFKKKNTLAKMLKSIIFSSTVAHHAMNHFAVWHSVAFPFSLPGIFKKLPSVKGQPVNVMDYVIPGSSVPLFMHQIIIYNMPTPPSFNLFNAYSGEAFSSCTKLSSVIAKWKSDLKTIEDVITNAEKNEASPYRILLPSDLTFDSLV